MKDTSNAIIKLENLSKSFNETVALKDVNLYFNHHEFLTLLGPSGCGKTTLLRIIAGFEQQDEGKVYFDGKCIDGVPPHKRRVNTVFQNYALFPHMNVEENIAFSLKVKKKSKIEIKQKVKEMLKLVNLEGYEKRKISTLSGGQQQRIAIARALVSEPEILLLDEPLGALDLKMRKEMQIELKNIQQQLGITFIFVTHDQEEALAMSDTICVFKDGEIQQIGTPEDIYNEPKNAFVADFIGESNIVSGVMKHDRLVKFAGHDFLCVDGGFEKNEPVDVVIRPEDFQLTDHGASWSMLNGEVVGVTFKGVHYEMWILVDETYFLVQSTEMREVGDRVGLAVKPDLIHVMKKSIYSNDYEKNEVWDNLFSENDSTEDELAESQNTDNANIDNECDEKEE